MNEWFVSPFYCLLDPLTPLLELYFLSQRCWEVRRDEAGGRVVAAERRVCDLEALCSEAGAFSRRV